MTAESSQPRDEYRLEVLATVDHGAGGVVHPQHLSGLGDRHLVFQNGVEHRGSGLFFLVQCHILHRMDICAGQLVRTLSLTFDTRPARFCPALDIIWGVLPHHILPTCVGVVTPPERIAPDPRSCEGLVPPRDPVHRRRTKARIHGQSKSP